MSTMSLGCNLLDRLCYLNGKESFIERYGAPLLLEFPSSPGQLDKYRLWSLFYLVIKRFKQFHLSCGYRAARSLKGGLLT